MTKSILNLIFISIISFCSQGIVKADKISIFSSLNHIKTFNNFGLPFIHKYYKDTLTNNEYKMVFINNKDFVIMDSSSLNTKEFGNICFFFLAAKPEDEFNNLQCPTNYGLIIQNENGQLILNSFWEDDTSGAIRGNGGPELFKTVTLNGERIFLRIFETGCGSGGDEIIFEMIKTEGKIEFNEIINAQLGYSTIHFDNEKNVYYKFEKTVLDCHYGCPSKYDITCYSLVNNQIISKKRTKYDYEDYCDFESGIAEIISKIQKKEPGIIK